MPSLVRPGQMCHRPVNGTVPNLMSVRSERPVSRAWLDGGGRGSLQLRLYLLQGRLAAVADDPPAPFERCAAL